MITNEGPTKDVMAALVAMQVALTNPTTDAKARVKMKQGGEYGYSYLSLPALLDHIAVPRREAGIAVAQEVAGDPQVIAVTTYLFHLSGQWVAFGPAVFPAPADPQQRGAVISYLRRYSLLAALGLAAEDDDAGSAKLEPRGTVAEVRVAPGMGEADGAGSAAYGEGAAGPAPTTPEGEAPSPGAASTPSGQPDGHHEHTWAPSPTMPGWRWCTVRGCGKAEKAPKEAPV